MSRKNAFTENVDKVVGVRLQKLRLAKGLSRQQLAAKIGVTHQQLQKYEKGTNRMSVGRLVAIANELNKPITYFCDDANSIDESLITQHHRMTMEVARNFARIKNPTNQYAVNQLVKTLAANV